MFHGKIILRENMRIICVGLILLTFFSNVHANNDCVAIDGPANLRDEPNLKSKVLHSIPKGSVVLRPDSPGGNMKSSTEVPSGWQYIHGYKYDQGITKCAYDEDDEKFLGGWIHSSNFLKLSFKELLSLDYLGVLGSFATKQDLNGVKRIEFVKNCDCAEVHSYSHDRGSLNLKRFESGSILGEACKVNSLVAVCEEKIYDHTLRVVCPIDACIKITEAIKLTDSDRRTRLESAAQVASIIVKKQISKSFLKEIENKLPRWIPFLLPKFGRDTDYSYELVLQPFNLEANFVWEGEMKKRKMVLVYETIEDAFAQTPSLVFQGKKGLESRKMPFDLKLSSQDISLPRVCLAIDNSNFAIMACRSQDEIAPILGAFDIKAPHPIQMSKDAAEKIKGEHWCCDSRNKPTPFFEFLPQQ
jgi:hypothetical protein